jgi:hypothetical protein
MNKYTGNLKAFSIAYINVKLLATLSTIDERCNAICITALSQTKMNSSRQ